MDWDQLIRHQALIVSGKGGTGKSTVAAAVAMFAARRGRKVLLAELEGRHEVTRTLGIPDPGFEERPTPSGFSVISIDPVQAAVEYLRIYGGRLGGIGRPLSRAGLLDQVVGVAPGFRDLLTTGKLYEIGHLRRTKPRDRGRPLYDLIVVDAPPTGQIAGFLAAAGTFADLVRVGPVKRRAAGVAEFLHRRAMAVLVSIPEEMSVAETLETIPAVGRSGVRLGAIVVNRLAPAPLAKGTRQAFHRLDPDRMAELARATGLPLAPDEARELLEETRVADARHREQRGWTDQLARAGPVLQLPDVAEGSPSAVARELAAAIAGAAPVSAVTPSAASSSSPDRARIESSIEPHLSGARILVVCGAGGVGKTSISAALALHRAAGGTDTALLTVDPARRLATALRLPMTAGERTDVSLGRGRHLLAMQLDTQRTFDELIVRFAGSRERQDKILSNPFYRRIADTLAGTHEYMAMEKLYELAQEEDHDLIVVDTPPTRSALSFLEAPNRVTDFLGGRFQRWMLWPTARASRFTLSAARFGADAFLRTAGRLVGAEALADTIDFLASFEGMYGRFKERAGRVLDLLRSPECAFVVVTAPARPGLEEAGYFLDRLSEARMRAAAVVVNRWHAEGRALPPAARQAAGRLASSGSAEDRAAGSVLAARIREEPRRNAEATAVASFAARHPETAILAVPEMAGDVHDVAGLRRMGAYLLAKRPHP